MSKSETRWEHGENEELNRFLAPTPLQFRAQFVGRRPGPDLTILKEVGLEATDVSSAIVAAATKAFPPETIGLRILDPQGRQVFARQKTIR